MIHAQGGITFESLMEIEKKKKNSNYTYYSKLMIAYVCFVIRRPTSYMPMTSSDNSFIKKLKNSGRSLVVFYGSQTGTGEEFAGRLAKEGIRYKMKGMVADPEECDMVKKNKIKNSL